MRPVGLLVLVVASGHGKAVRVFDRRTVLGQLGKGPAVRPVAAAPAAPEEVAAQGSARERENLLVVDEADRLLGEKMIDELLALFAERAVVVDLAAPRDVTSREAYVRGLRAFAAAFPDFTWESTDRWAAGSYVVDVVRWRGRHTGPLGDLRATGRKLEMTEHLIWKLDGGRVEKLWIFYDGADFLGQLGAAGARRP
jgi:predicted ester cyclase